eukprot:CAMPEP_0174717226 /NCGR_PEP_ID=MMETSP1094-20130205/26231_1 /TAXON_ID=156173 /ORGANISM="Chrysochromulina brevifilum, Strain UTEX LB 985" /LENGTH=47 /DNA_ID= /DNA_START= /DNA_END= /DNA_ORIENTATION=
MAAEFKPGGHLGQMCDSNASRAPLRQALRQTVGCVALEGVLWHGSMF